MRVLIVGAAGQLGRELQQAAPAGPEVVALARAELDLGDGEAVERVVGELRPDLTLNAGAYTAVDRAEEASEEAFAVNAEGVGRLAAAVARCEGRLIHVSTDFVFGGDTERPYAPSDPPAPLGVYGRSKLEGERLAREAAGDRLLLIRAAWLYSRFGKNFVKTILRLLREREVVEVVSDQVGSPTWARRLAEAIWLFVERPELAGTFHWADAGTASWYELAVAIREEALEAGLVESPAAVRPVRASDFGAKAPRPAFSALDSRATWDALGAEPWHWRRSLRAMLAELET